MLCHDDAVPSKEMLNQPDVSVTTTLKLVVALLPDPSVKVYVTVVVPTLKKVPGEWVLPVRVTTPELSVAVGSVQVTVVPVLPDETVLKISSMPLITGGVVSAK